jgi:hypothetical protein
VKDTAFIREYVKGTALIKSVITKKLEGAINEMDKLLMT